MKTHEDDTQQRNTFNSAFEKEINELRIQHTNLHQQITSEQSKLEEMREQTGRMQTHIQQTSSQITTLTQQREELSSSLESQQSQQKLQSEECDHLCQQMEEYDEKKRKCTQEWEQVSNELNAIQRAIQQMEVDIQIQRETVLAELESEIQKRNVENETLREGIQARRNRMVLPVLQDAFDEKDGGLKQCSIQRLGDLIQQLTLLRDQRKKQFLLLQQGGEVMIPATTNIQNKIEQLMKEQRAIERELQKAKEENGHSIDLTNDAEMQSVCMCIYIICHCLPLFVIVVYI